MPSNSHLIIRPNYRDYPYDITRYGAAFFTQIINAANSAGLPTTDLYASNATRTNFENYLITQDPILVNIFGHGNYNQIACQNDQLLLQGCWNDQNLAGRVIFDLSCQAGRDLGPSAVSKGAVSFLGYNQTFGLYIDDRIPHGQELNDEVARGFFESHNAAPISYIQTKNLSQSFAKSQATFDFWIKVWENINDPSLAPFVVTELMNDRSYQVIIPTPPPTSAFPIWIFALLIAIPFLGGKYLKKVKPL